MTGSAWLGLVLFFVPRWRGSDSTAGAARAWLFLGIALSFGLAMVVAVRARRTIRRAPADRLGEPARLEVVPSPATETVLEDAPMGDGLTTVRLFPAKPTSLFEVRQFVRACAQETALDEESVDELVLAVSEACGNVVRHSASRSILVGWRALDQVIEVRVRDEGVFGRTLSLPDSNATGGWGIPLMLALVDEFSLREGSVGRPGTTVRLVKYA